MPTRSSLVERVRDLADHEAWEDFYRTYHGLIYRLAMKDGLTAEEAEDVAQDVFIGISRNIKGFEYDRRRSSFKHWLTKMVQWRITDRRKMRLPTWTTPHGTDWDSNGVVDVPEGIESPEVDSVSDEEWHTAQIEWATRRVRRKVSDKQFQIFYLRVLKGMSVADVARRLNVSSAQVYLAKLRVGRVYREILNGLGETPL